MIKLVSMATARGVVLVALFSSLLVQCFGIFDKSFRSCKAFQKLPSSCNIRRAFYEEHDLSSSSCRKHCEYLDGLCLAYQVPSAAAGSQGKLKKCLIITGFRGEMEGNDRDYDCFKHVCDGEGVCYDARPGRCKKPSGWIVENSPLNGLAACAELCKYTHRDKDMCQGFQWRKGKCALYVNPEANFDDDGVEYQNDLTASSRDRKSQCFTKSRSDCRDEFPFVPAAGPLSCYGEKEERATPGACRNNVKKFGVFKNFPLPSDVYQPDDVQTFCRRYCNLFDEMCKGYEYQPSDGTCEVHFASIDDVAPFGNGRECVRRVPGETCWSGSSGLGFCREPDGGSGKPDFCKACTTVTACRNACLLRDDCTAFEWHEGRRKPRCEIHTSPITSTQFSTSKSIPLCYIKK